MSDVLVIRPEPGSSRTAARLRSLGHEVVVAPIFAVKALPWRVPAVAPAAIAFTSAHAPAAVVPADWRQRPCYAVGERTAGAARQAGFTDVRASGSDAAAVFVRAAADGVREITHLCGADVSAFSAPPGLEVTAIPVYVAEPLTPLPSAAAALIATTHPWVLLYSARAASHFAALLDAAALPRARVRLAALSASIAAAAGPGWSTVALGTMPTEEAMLRAAGLLASGRILDMPGPQP